MHVGRILPWFNRGRRQPLLCFVPSDRKGERPGRPLKRQKSDSKHPDRLAAATGCGAAGATPNSIRGARPWRKHSGARRVCSRLVEVDGSPGMSMRRQLQDFKSCRSPCCVRQPRVATPSARGMTHRGPAPVWADISARLFCSKHAILVL